jgi:hypothetical protein
MLRCKRKSAAWRAIRRASSGVDRFFVSPSRSRPHLSQGNNNRRVTVKKLATALLSISAVTMAAPAIAQDAPSAAPAAPAAQAAAAKAGDTIYDSAGEAVGTIESVEGQNAVISTGTAKATVPLSAFASGPKGPTIGMTKAQLEAAIQAAGNPGAAAGTGQAAPSAGE